MLSWISWATAVWLSYCFVRLHSTYRLSSLAIWRIGNRKARSFTPSQLLIIFEYRNCGQSLPDDMYIFHQSPLLISSFARYLVVLCLVSSMLVLVKPELLWYFQRQNLAVEVRRICWRISINDQYTMKDDKRLRIPNKPTSIIIICCWSQQTSRKRAQGSWSKWIIYSLIYMEDLSQDTEPFISL